MLTIIKKYIHILRAKLRYILFNTSSVIVLDRRLKDIEAVSHPTKGYLWLDENLLLQGEDEVVLKTLPLLVSCGNTTCTLTPYRRYLWHVKSHS